MFGDSGWEAPKLASGQRGNSGNDPARTLAEADAGQAGRLAIATKRNLITIFEK
jgi:hypothetical protein